MVQIAIIGSGIVGATIAYELSQIRDFKITLLDRQTPASGSTGAALGVLMGVISKKKTGKGWQIREQSLQRYDTLIPELEALTGRKILYNRQGLLKLCFEGENLQKWEKLIKTRQGQGWQLSFWNRQQLHEKCPQINSDNLLGAIYSPQDRQVDPTALTQALVTAAQQNGVDCQFGIAIEDFRSSQNIEEKINQLATTTGILRVDWLIIAAGLGSTALTASLRYPIDIRPVLGQALRFRVDRSLGLQDFQPVITGEDIHLIPLGNQEYWLGATVEFPTIKESEADPRQLEEIWQKAVAFCPELETATVLKTWSGKRPRPEGRLAPIIELLPGYSNVILATGHYRNGVLLAPATAKAVIEFLK